MNLGMTTTERLTEIAERLRGEPIGRAELENPDFSDKGWPSLWSYYVEDDLQEVWHELSTDARLVACVSALERQRRDLERATF
jgi:hypothetical protein